MGSYLLKAQLQMQSTGAFSMFLWSNNKLLSMLLLAYIFPCLNQLIELFRSKENFKEKVGSDRNRKSTWPRMSLIDIYLYDYH